MTKAKDMPSRAREHARIAARHSTMKGIPPSDAGVCFIAEGLSLCYSIDPVLASKLVQHLVPHANEFLERGILETFATSVGVTTEEAEIMIAKAKQQLPTAG